MDVTSYLLGKNSSGGGSGGGLDWAALGYSNGPKLLIKNYNYSKEIQQNWDPSQSIQSKFKSDYNLAYMPLIDISSSTSMYQTCYDCLRLEAIANLDTSKITTMQQAFYGCSRLVDVPELDTKSITGNNGLNSTFSSCIALSDDSVNNILRMCINATSYTGTKTLQYLGLRITYYPISRLETLSNYQDFLNAGWTAGY